MKDDNPIGVVFVEAVHQSMDNPMKTRMIITIAAAIVITFGRDGMLTYMGIFSPPGKALDYFVGIVAPVFAIAAMFQRPLERRIALLAPALALFFWMGVVVLMETPSSSWPNHSILITDVLAILFCSLIRISDLRYIRLSILALAALFNICAVVYARSTLGHLLGGGLIHVRFGNNISPYNTIIFPRNMYTIVLTCLVTILIEKQKALKIAAAGLMVVPLIMGIATGTRGPLIALLVAVCIFVLGSRRKAGANIPLALFGFFLFAGFEAFLHFSPAMRLENLMNPEGHLSAMRTAFQNITLLGHGIASNYPHNIFLESLKYYGIVGLLLFLVVLAVTVTAAWKVYSSTRDSEVLWSICLLALQFTAQQFSLSMILASALWGTMVLPLGLLSAMGPRPRAARARKTPRGLPSAAAVRRAAI